MGYKSLSVFAAPSGHGKSTFALSVAYYAAMNGAYVDYLSFEIPFDHAWFNIASLYSEDKDIKIKSSDLKECTTTEEQDEAYKVYVNEVMNHIAASGGYLNIVDQSQGSAPTFAELCARLEAMADERKRPADLIVIDNVDNFQVLKSSERDEATRINNYIVSLDSFCKEYHNGDGTAILLLSQVNRPAMKKLYTSDSEDSERKVKIDVTCIQKYNALYEKATCVLVAFSDAATRARNMMRIYPVKLRNRPIPSRPVEVQVNFKYSKVLGDFPDKSYTQEEVVEVVDNSLYPTLNGSEVDKELENELLDFEDDI
jgi:hypothetical protein